MPNQANSGAVWSETRVAGVSGPMDIVPLRNDGNPNGWVVGDLGEAPQALLLADGGGGYTLSPSASNPTALGELKMLEMGAGTNRVRTYE